MFVRGDVNAVGDIDISDPVFQLGFLFADGAEPPCLAASDANSDGTSVASPIRVVYSVTRALIQEVDITFC